MYKILPLLLFFVLTQPCINAAADQAVSCHCFSDRTYNPDDRFAADDYLLTTVFNSLTAGYFSISKRQIVMLKMKGRIQNDDLLIGLYISRQTGIEVDDLLGRKNKTSWRQVLSEMKVPDSFREDPLYKQEMVGISNGQAADAIAEKMLADQFAVSHDTLQKMMQQGISLRQLALIFTLADYSQTEPEKISSLHRDRGLSWSEIAYNFGLQPVDAGKLAEKLGTEKQ